MAHQRIEIDHEKCATPYACKKCLQICPQAVLSVVTLKMEKFKETDENEPGAFRLRVAFGDKCTVCNDCVDVCPNGALNVSYG
ncbi:MAG: 4Fe-4S dicluster domain-containing protein [Candidatus Adiutricales bacterium]